MWKDSVAKYRGLFISTTAFFVFFLLYLLVNNVIQRNAIVAVEYVHLVQALEQDVAQNGLSKKVLEEVYVFKSGGQSSLNVLTNQDITIPPIADHLSPVNYTITPVLVALNTDSLSQVKSNLQLLSNLVLEKKTRSLKLTKTLSVIAAILTVLLYFMVIVQFVFRLSKTDVSEVQSRQETDSIMSTISEGIFLLDNNLSIGAEQSASLKAMFKNEKDLEGDFLEFISHYVTQNNVDLAREYLTLLFGDRVKERLVEELNPLKKVEVSLVRRDGSFENHYLDFKFKRVFVDDKISHLLCSVNDITKQVLLEQELSAVQEAQEAQLDMLKSILHVDANRLSLFFSHTENALREINQTLEIKRKGFSDIDMRKILDKITANIHRVKGDSAALGLHKFEFSAHDFEEEIDRIKKENTKITGKELLPLITLLRMMFSDVDDMKELVNKFSGISASFTQADNASVDLRSSIKESVGTMSDIDVADTLSQLVDTVSQRNGKSVKANIRGLKSQEVPETLVGVVQSVAVQFLRNSIVHGIEPIDERQTALKPDQAVIDIIFTHTTKGYLLTVRDDGCGIDEQAIINKAIAKGIVSAEKATTIPLAKAPIFLFHPGFSIRDEASIDAGRGVGLDVVKSLVDDMNGKLNVTYEKGQYCQFRVLFPLS
jgi:two-component system, chemotaxis family, sensor kinase CheA